MNYQLYIVGFAAFGVLFLMSHGTFQASASFLRKKIPYLDEYASEDLLKKALMLLFIFHLLGLLSAFSASTKNLAAKGYLMRNAYGEGDRSETLTVKNDDQEETIHVNIPERKLSQKETRANLTEAKKRLPDTLLGDMDASHVDEDLNFVSEFSDLFVDITYMTSDPEIVDWNGTLGDSIPEKGVPVTITAKLSLGETAAEEEIMTFNVFPKKLTSSQALTRSVESWISSHNDATKEKVTLPQSLSGKDVSWSEATDNMGPWILALGWIAFGLVLYSQQEKKKRQDAEKSRLLLIDYPHIVSRFSLLLDAGLSERKALAQITRRYQRKKKESGEIRPGFELLVNAQEEMCRGESELKAYQDIGRSVELMEYRNFSNLLIQNLTRGGREMLILMRKEADRSLMDRRGRASVLGDEAGTKMLFPMMLLLGVVMAILMIPALFSFSF